MSLRLRLSVIIAVLVASLPASTPAPASACRLGCTPIALILTYMEGFSNWGPSQATGIAELVLAEGEVRGRVTGLPTLTDEVYEVWLVDSHTDEALAFGGFNTDQDQRGQFRFIVEEDIPDRNWNLLLITVQPAGDGPGRRSDRRSIGAFFPGEEAQPAMPRELPNTGGAGAGASAGPAWLDPLVTSAPAPSQDTPRETVAPAAPAPPEPGSTPRAAGALPLSTGQAILFGLAGLFASLTLRRQGRR